MKSKVDPLSVLAIVVTVLAFSATAPLTAFATAPAFALAFWRNGLGFTALGPVLLALRRGELGRILRRERLVLRRRQRRSLCLGVLAALLLAVHFATFMSSVKLTSVAMATTIVATQPIWVALISRAQGGRLSRRAWLGLAAAVIGAAFAAGFDVQVGGKALIGDLLALAGAVSLAGYAALSEHARAEVSTPLYSAMSALVCASALLILCLATGTPLTGLNRSSELAVAGLLIFPQLLGLGSMNFALGRASATTIGVALLLESPVAAAIAWLWMGQRPSASTVPGLLLTVVGIIAVVIPGDSASRDRPAGRHRTDLSAAGRLPAGGIAAAPTAVRSYGAAAAPRAAAVVLAEREPFPGMSDPDDDTLVLSIRPGGFFGAERVPTSPAQVDEF
jgi:drug/metabolite transporter (DMT)-like permease